MFSACAVNSLRMTGFFFFNDTATTEIYTLSLHDALPISIQSACAEPEGRNDRCAGQVQVTCHPERRVGVRKGAKDRRAARGSAPGFVRRSFAPTRAPALSLRMTGSVVLDATPCLRVRPCLRDPTSHNSLRLDVALRSRPATAHAQR